MALQHIKSKSNACFDTTWGQDENMFFLFLIWVDCPFKYWIFLRLGGSFGWVICHVTFTFLVSTLPWILAACQPPPITSTCTATVYSYHTQWSHINVQSQETSSPLLSTYCCSGSSSCEVYSHQPMLTHFYQLVNYLVGRNGRNSWKILSHPDNFTSRWWHPVTSATL